MEFTNEFHIPVDADTALVTLTDLEKVAPCLPGAKLEEAEGDAYKGRVKIKVGPIQVVYAGTARVVEVDHEAKRARIEAAGKEIRGSGTAGAEVAAALEEDADGTTVTVTTDLNITGRPAQFGRGVMADVGTRIIDTFAERLRALFEEEQTPAGAAEAGAHAGDTRTAPSAATTAAPADEPLDLMDVAGTAVAKRLLPVVGGLLTVVVVVWWLRRR